MVATAVGGLAVLPSWATRWTPESLRATGPMGGLISSAETNLLAELVETIIPATPATDPSKGEIPGAKALNVHQFVQKMVADCYDKAAQDTFRKGFTALDEVAKATGGKSFLETDAAGRLNVLKQMQQSTVPGQKEFLSLVKNLTIRGYMNSEYVMTNLTHYEMVPGRYKGCVPVAG
ncbi:gluconate 2-dehydrogenase subunit 3 family protein [Rudanella paleaurantiibacter]|uniref:gluconate 2-dehydrogenase subunit 3 family protein n=1 Tax=Rudanella paleaurantiibacter TaxID=2614655 RepID=UPI001626BD51|nr:gluconate 2-dehydrogenase subunit 3 family protein [Rudanella paleaurantiibacter]